MTSENYDGSRSADLLPYFSQAGNDIDISSDIPSFGEMLARRGADQSDITDVPDGNGKSAFLRSEKASYQAGDFDGRDVSRAGDTMTGLYKKRYGYTPSPGELIQFANLNGLRSTHDLPIDQVINSPRLESLHKIDVRPDQFEDYLAGNDYFVQKRKEAAQSDPLTNGYLWNASQAKKDVDPFYQMAMEAADRRPSWENAA
ncbi:hypothetical protein ACO0LH_00910 [Undibacterium sp. TJN19]